MAKTKGQKQEILDNLTDNLKAGVSVVFANIQGLKMKEVEEIRRAARAEGIVCIASKKTLISRSLKEVGLDVDTKSFNGGVAVFIGTKDEVAPAQLVAKFAKKNELLSIFGGVLESQFIDANKVKALSALPSKQQLLGQLVGTLQAPVSGFVNVLAGNLRGLVTVLNGIKDKQSA